MATIEEPVAVDGDKLEQFVFRAVDEVGATLNAALVVMGDKLGLLPRAGRRRPAHAGRAGRAHRRGRALRARVAERPGGRRLRRVRPRAAARYTLPPEQTVALTDDGQPRVPAGLLPDRARLGASTRRASPRRPAAATGVGWHEHSHDVFEGCERFFRPGYNANLVAVLAAGARRRGREARARREGRRRRLRPRRVDDPDGPGVPELDVRRLRLPRRVDRDGARARAQEAGVADRVTLRARAGRRRIPGAATTWSRCSTACTTWATRSARRQARPRRDRGRRHLDDRRADGRRPRRGQPQPGRPRVLRVLDVPVHAGLAVAGGRACARRAGGSGSHRRRRRAGGFGRFRRAAETPFNLVFEARP